VRGSNAGLLLVLGGVLALLAWSRTDRGRAELVDLMQRAAMWSPSKRAEIFRPLFDEASRRYALPPNLLMRQADVESGYDPNARSGKGALGIMQIIPRWHPELDPGDAAADARAALDPARAIPYAAKLLRSYRDRYGSWTLALAAYNAGPTIVEQYGRAVPPFAETRAYVSKILAAVGIVEPGVRYA
jgi:soluble lytic murein transglycosylase-like protein